MAESATEAAVWMVEELGRTKQLDQSYAADIISQRFGSALTYENENGNLAISKIVLAKFDAMTGRGVVRSRNARCWRPREPGDEPSRTQR